MRDGAYVAVVGAANVDILGRSIRPLRARDSNPGAVVSSFGGVGRNVAHNLRLLGVPTGLLTALGGDGWARALEEDCAAIGLDLSQSLRVPDGRTGVYLAIAGPDGDMALALCDTALTDALTPEVIEARLPWLNAAAAVVFDCNLSQPTIEALCARCAAPLFADPVSVAKAERLRSVLPYLHTIKPNRLEAEALTGESDALAAARKLREMGARRVFVSDGTDGLALADETRALRVPCLPVELVNATGGGDAVMAALVRAYLDGRSAGAAARFALAAGAIAVESAETVCAGLSAEAVTRRVCASPWGEAVGEAD